MCYNISIKEIRRDQKEIEMIEELKNPSYWVVVVQNSFGELEALHYYGASEKHVRSQINSCVYPRVILISKEF